MAFLCFGMRLKFFGTGYYFYELKPRLPFLNKAIVLLNFNFKFGKEFGCSFFFFLFFEQCKKKRLGYENGNIVRPLILNLKMASFWRLSMIIRYFDRPNQLRCSRQRKSPQLQEAVLEASILHLLLLDVSTLKSITPLCTFEMDANLLW